MQPAAGKPCIWNFLSTRDYVTAYDEWARTSLRGYSRRAFSRWAHISSPNALTLVISGKRRLSKDWLPGFIQAAKLQGDEAKFLELLARLENSPDRLEREKLLEDAYSLVSTNSHLSLAGTTLTLIHNPLAWTLYHMIEIPGQDGSAKWFKAHLRRKVPVPEIQEGLELLLRLGLAVRKPSGALQGQSLHIESPDQIREAQNASFHRHVLAEAARFIDENEPAERAFGSGTLLVPEDRVEEFRAEVNKFGRKLLQQYEKSGARARLYRFNIQVYPLTITPEPTE